MEIQEDLVDYIWKHYQNYWTDLEQEANAHHFAQENLLRFKDRGIPEVNERYSKLTSTNPKVLALLQDGYSTFIKNVATRIYHEDRKNLNINRCPKCNGLARTPKARQCRYCFHSWY